MRVTWSLKNPTTVNSPTLHLQYTTIGVPQSDHNPPQQLVTFTTSAIRIDAMEYVWDAPIIFYDGNYRINGTTDDHAVVLSSTPFTYTISDSSCLVTDPSTSDPGSHSPSPSQIQGDSNSGSHKSNTGAIAGGIVAFVLFGVLLGAFCFYRKRRESQARMSKARANMGGRFHKWGGLNSDKRPLPSGLNTPSSPAGSPFGVTTFGRTRSNSAGNMLEDDGTEKSNDHEDPDKYDTLPTLRRNSNRYSNGALTAALSKQSSGLAAFTSERIQSTQPPIVAASVPYEDPFSDPKHFVPRGKRVSNLSVPSTARTDHRASDVPSPIASSAGNISPVPPARVPSNGGILRPTRKPVPQYIDNSIELKDTSTQSNYNRSLPDHGGSATSHNILSSSVDSSLNWLHDRSSIPGDGQVHYLMPDQPHSRD